MNEISDKLWFQILKTLSTTDLPQGAGSVSDALRCAGYSVSEAAAGRILRDMRKEGLLERVGFQGHTITREGAEQMHVLGARIRISDTLSACIGDARERGKLYLRDALLALRSLGRETVFETVRCASDEELSRIGEILERNPAECGEQPNEGLFKEFYQSLLATSKIPIFEHFFNLLEVSVMSDARLLNAFRRAECSLDGTYGAILDNIKARRPEIAANMVDSQIDKVISQIMAETEADKG